MKLVVENEAPTLDLTVGALVVYGSHGMGRVSDVDSATVALEFPAGLSVVLPLERARACLRPVSGVAELDAVRAVLRDRDVTIETSPQVRRRATGTKITTGDPVGLAEVVRDAVERKRRLAAGSTLSPAEHAQYQKARHLLATELSAAADLDEAEADEWIETQLQWAGE